MKKWLTGLYLFLSPFLYGTPLDAVIRHYYGECGLSENLAPFWKEGKELPYGL